MAQLRLAAESAFQQTTSATTEGKAHVEPADEGGYSSYIIMLKQPPGGYQDMDADALRAWHQSFLPSMRTTLGEKRLQHSYRTVFDGFAERLTEEELKEVSAKPGFVRSFPDVIYYLDTMGGVPRPAE